MWDRTETRFVLIVIIVLQLCASLTITDRARSSLLESARQRPADRPAPTEQRHEVRHECLRPLDQRHVPQLQQGAALARLRRPAPHDALSGAAAASYLLTLLTRFSLTPHLLACVLTCSRSCSLLTSSPLARFSLTLSQSAIFGLVSTIVGGGVLSLPFAFAQTGLVLGTALLLGSAAASEFTIQLVVSCARWAAPPPPAAL